MQSKHQGTRYRDLEFQTGQPQAFHAQDYICTRTRGLRLFAAVYDGSTPRPKSKQISSRVVHANYLHHSLPSRSTLEITVLPVAFSAEATRLRPTQKMFNGISTLQTCRAANQTVNCNLPGPQGFETNPDIAGIGVCCSIAFAQISNQPADTTQVVSAYEVTALLTLISATFLMFTDVSDLFRVNDRRGRFEEIQE